MGIIMATVGPTKNSPVSNSAVSAIRVHEYRLLQVPVECNFGCALRRGLPHAVPGLRRAVAFGRQSNSG